MSVTLILKTLTEANHEEKESNNRKSDYSKRYQDFNMTHITKIAMKLWIMFIINSERSP